MRVSGRVLLVITLLASPALAANSHGNRRNHVTSVDPGYISALAAANRFLYAWQTGDLEAGMVLLSDHARHSQTPDKMELFFSGTEQRAFEIVRGSGKPGRYTFPIVLLDGQGKRIHRTFSEIILVNTGKNDWAVDKLP